MFVVMAQLQILNDPKFKNWQKSTLGLLNLKHGLEEFITKRADLIHKDLITTVAKELDYALPIDCSSQTYIPTGIVWKPGLEYNCPLDGTSDYKQCSKQCPNAVCYSYVRNLRKIHTWRTPIWQNTKPSEWTKNPWEIAKCFLPVSGYENSKSAEDTDCAGLLSIMINMEPIIEALGKKPRDKTEIRKVVKEVNTVMI